ncbi:kinase-like protein [Annulohypoxylon nitens]|nr:kinase-like protein [Annulohypoxylon nitens]
MASSTPSEDYDYPIDYYQECQLASKQFSRWRRLGGRARWSARHIHKSREAWHKRKLPRPGQPLFFGGKKGREPWKFFRFPSQRKSSEPDFNFPYSFDDPNQERVRQRVVSAVNYFDRAAHSFKYKKTLGHGGLGVALHYQYEGVQPGKDIAVKLSLNSWVASDIRREADATRAMARAAHCIQIIEPEKVGLPRSREYDDIMRDIDSSSDEESSGDESHDESSRPRIPHPRIPRNQLTPMDLAEKKQRREQRRIQRKNRMTDRTRKDYMLLEYVEGGNLLTLIDKMVVNEYSYIPNRVLWQLWLCLVRSCVAMKYPPRKFHPDRPTRRRPNGRTDLIEMIPPPHKRWRAKNWVHFDIDPSNIFIGNIEIPPKRLQKRPYLPRVELAQPDRAPQEHSFVPILKMADFGLAREVKSHKRNIYYFSTRQNGKPYCYAPEQFAGEWDKINPVADGAEVSEQNIVGNYSSPMNVYQIALTMWNVITQFQQPTPVRPQIPLDQLDNIEPHRDWQDRTPSFVDELINTADPKVKISYCPLLMDKGPTAYDGIDVELRRTVYECMYHRPHDRPTIEALLAQAEAGIQKQFPGETDKHVQEWVIDWILNPGKPEAPQQPPNAG